MYLCSLSGFPMRYQIFKMIPKKNRQFIAFPSFYFSQAPQLNEQEKPFVQGGVDMLTCTLILWLAYKEHSNEEHS